MCVQYIDFSLANLTSEAKSKAAVKTGLPIEADHINALLLELFTEGADAVEAKNGGLNALAQAANDLGYQHLGTGDLHDVHHKADAKRGRPARGVRLR